MAQPQRAKVTLTLDHVPEPSAAGTIQPNGDRVVEDGDQRWRYRPDGRLRYYMRLQPGKGRSVLPWEELYEGPRS